MSKRNDPPLVAGGQGRSGDEIVDTATGFGLVCVWSVCILFCLGVYWLVARALGLL